MNANISKLLITMMLISFAGAAHAREFDAPVVVKTEGLPPHVAAKVEQKAAEGVTSLRRYAWITRSMHGLDIYALAREQAPPMAFDAKRPTQVAEKASGTR